MPTQDRVQSLTGTELTELLKKPDIVFVDFWAKWCAPCQQFAPIYARISQQYETIVFASIDIEQEQAFSEALHIRTIPHLMVFKEGIAIYSESGTVPESILCELAEQALTADVTTIRAQLADEEKNKTKDTEN